MSEQLTDLFGIAIGSVGIARGSRASFVDKKNTVDSGTNGYASPEYRDFHHWTITSTIEAEDPRAAVLVAALAFPQAVCASGCLIGTDTWRKHNQPHAVLEEVAVSLEDGKPGTSSFSFRTLGASGSTLLAQEHSAVDITRPSTIVRAGTYALKAAAFTPDGGGAVAIPGFTKVDWRARRQVIEASAENGSLFENIIDYGAWEVSGAITIRGQALSGGLTLPQYLATLRRGTLAVTASQTGAWDAGGLVDVIFQFNRLAFGQTDGSLREKGRSEAPAQFDGLLRSAAGNVLAINDMLAAA